MMEQFSPYAVELKNRDKVLYPDSGFTKGDVIDYYRKIANLMIPWLKNRVLTLQRFPDGIDAEGFFQKNIPDYFPPWVTRRTVEVSDGRQQVPVCSNLASLVYDRINRREGKLYLDVQRNAYGQTAVAPFSLRARAGAPVATPLPRRALDNPELHSRVYTLDNIYQYIEETGNPWQNLRRRASGLASARKKLDSLLSEAWACT